MNRGGIYEKMSDWTIIIYVTQCVKKTGSIVLYTHTYVWESVNLLNF